MAAFSLNELLSEYDLTTFPALIIVDNARSPSCPVSVPRCNKKKRRESKQYESSCSKVHRPRWESIGKNEHGSQIVQRMENSAPPQQPRRKTSLDFNRSGLKCVFSSDSSFASFGSDCAYYEGSSDLTFEPTSANGIVLRRRTGNARVTRAPLKASSFDDTFLFSERSHQLKKMKSIYDAPGALFFKRPFTHASLKMIRQPCREKKNSIDADHPAPSLVKHLDLAASLNLIRHPYRKKTNKIDAPCEPITKLPLDLGASFKMISPNDANSTFDCTAKHVHKRGMIKALNLSRQQTEAIASLARIVPDQCLQKPERHLSFDRSATLQAILVDCEH
jgi:hypothetical protein